MLHAISFSQGAATVYRNRWVQTVKWAEYNGIDPDAARVDSNPNVNVIRHAGVILALAEGGPPVAINRELETSGASELHESLAKGNTAHPKIDPVTQELITFRADWSRPSLSYGVLDANGRETLDMEIELPAPAMMHDMAVTETRSIFMDLNVGFDFDMLQRGYRLPIRWHDSRRSRLGIVDRHGGDVRWLEIEPCFIQHVVNAHDRADGSIILNVVRYPSYFKVDPESQSMLPNPLGVLWQYEIDRQLHSISERQLSALHIELPAINEARTGRFNRYFFALEQPSSVEMRGVVRYDLHTGEIQHHLVAPGDQNSEPVFVARPGGRAEDDGWLLVCVYRHASQTTEVRILDARDIAAAPLATVALGRRIPAGFHGAWIPSE